MFTVQPQWCKMSSHNKAVIRGTCALVPHDDSAICYKMIVLVLFLAVGSCLAIWVNVFHVCSNMLYCSFFPGSASKRTANAGMSLAWFTRFGSYLTYIHTILLYYVMVDMNEILYNHSFNICLNGDINAANKIVMTHNWLKIDFSHN